MWDRWRSTESALPYLINLSLVSGDALLGLLLKDLLSFLHILLGAGGQWVVKLVIALVHHVPISVCLL